MKGPIQLQRLTSFEGLGIGDKVTKVTLTGFQTFEFMGYDPHLKNDKSRYDYAYLMESFGRVKCNRWYKSCLEREHIYIGYDSEFVRLVEISLLEERLESLKNKTF